MNGIKQLFVNLFVILIALMVLLNVRSGYLYWQEHYQSGELGQLVKSKNGFTTLPRVDGANNQVVMIFAAVNCSHEEAQRADNLAADLSRLGIPVSRLDNIRFDLTDADNESMERVDSIMNDKLPIVFVNNRAKSNPKLEEVIAEVKSTQQ